MRRWGITVNQIAFKSVSNNFRGYTAVLCQHYQQYIIVHVVCHSQHHDA